MIMSMMWTVDTRRIPLAMRRLGNFGEDPGLKKARERYKKFLEARRPRRQEERGSSHDRRLPSLGM